MVDRKNSTRMSACMRIGVSPLSWVNEVLTDLGAGTTAETILREAHAAGFQGVELSRVFPSNPEALASLLAEYELQFISGWYSGFLAERPVEEELAEVRAHAQLLRTCGAKVMVYGECGHMAQDALDVPFSDRLALNNSDMAAYGERLTHFADIMRDEYGLELVYHHHLMMVAETLDEVRAVMKHTGSSVGLLLDTGHAQAGGFDYAVLIEEFGARIRHIHLKDVRADVMTKVRSDGLSFNEGVRRGMFTVPGDGSVDFAPLAKFLATGTYSGWLVVEAEQDPKLATPTETVARAYQFVADNILTSRGADARFPELA